MRLLLAFALAVPGLVSTACGDSCVRERCAYPALLLTVRDAATGTLLPDAIVSQGGIGVSAFPSACDSGQCTHAITPSTAGLVMIVLDGYKQASVNFVPAADACGNVVRQAVDVDLEVASASDPSTVSVTRALGAGCGG
jgi:hypothetical protein